MLNQVFAGWGGLLDAAGGGYVIRRHAVAKDGQRSGATDFPDLTGLQVKLQEEGRFLNIRAVRVPLIDVAGRGRDLVPLRILPCEVTIEPPKHVRLERR